MKYEDFGYVDIEKKQQIQNQNYEKLMHQKMNNVNTPSNNVQKPISSKDLKLTTKKVDWIIDKIIERKNLILLAGESSSGKTSLMYAMASAIGEGSKFLNTFSTKKGKVLFIQADESRSNCAHKIKIIGVSDNVDFLTIGQYLQPTKKHLKVQEYVDKDRFDEYKDYGLSIGFKVVESGPLVRSSYHADEQARMIFNNG